MRLSLLLLCSLFLTGCALGPAAAPSPEQGRALHGNVHGGRQPIVGAHVYLFAANNTAYGQPSVSLLNPSATGAATDPVGTYVTTDANGLFTITNDYSCTPNTQVYLYALGGDPGAGPNSAAGLIAVLGSCPASGSFLSSIPFVQINEVTTVAAAYSIAGFATDATHVSSSGTPAAQTGIANAFANAANIASLNTGQAYSTLPTGNGIVPQSKINTLADILAACVNSTGPSAGGCATVLTNAKDPSGATPAETASAAINIAHNPGANVATLFSALLPTPPFLPNLSSAPTDWTLALTITFNGGSLAQPADHLAIDAGGNVWVKNNAGGISRFGNIAKLSPSGTLLTSFTAGTNIAVGPTIDASGNVWTASDSALQKFDNNGNVLSGSGFSSNYVSNYSGIAFDKNGNAWTTNSNFGFPSQVYEFTSSGTPVPATQGFTGGGLQNSPLPAIDPSGNIWTAGGSNLAEFNTSGAISPSTGFTGGGLSSSSGIAIDSAGNIWVANTNSVSKFLNAGTPVSPSTGFTGGGLSNAAAIALDGAGTPWVANANSVSHLAADGTPISGSQGYAYDTTVTIRPSIAIDGSGNVWFPIPSIPFTLTSVSVEELVGAATPVVTPIAQGLATSTLATRP